MNLIEKIESLGYRIVDSGEKQNSTRINRLDLIRPDGDRRKIHYYHDQECAIGCGSCKTMAEAKAKAAAGTGIVVQADDIYRAYYKPENRAEWEYLTDEWDRRTAKAIADEKDHLHVLRYGGEDCGNPREFVGGTESTFQLGQNCIRCGQLDSGEWCAEYVGACGIDDYWLAWIFFDCQMPEPEIIKAIKLDKIITALWRGAIREEFDCWECGCHTHWTEAGSDIYEAAENAADKYCGC